MYQNLGGFLMNKKTIAIIFGGHSSEYSVSLESTYSLLQHINKDKYHLYLIGITHLGKWYHFDGPIEQIIQDTWWQNNLLEVVISPDPQKHGLLEISKQGIKHIYIDTIFPILHGKNGEDGTIQGLIQMTQIPLIGCDTLSSALCMDKAKAHNIVEHAGIRVPQSIVLNSLQELKEKEPLITQLSFPLFVKPMKAGSSYGISKITTYSELENAVCYAFTYDNQVIIEEAILGFEVGCAIIGFDKLIVGRVDEIELSHGFFDFNEKYTLQTSKIHMPARIDQEMEKKIQETAKIIYRTLGCQVFARVDMFLTPQNEIVFNEVNTIPGFTSHSRFPQMMRGIDINFEKLIDILIEMGLKHEDCYIS